MSFYDDCGNDKPLSIIAGPCAFESKDHAVEMAERLHNIIHDTGFLFGRSINFIYKTSFDKANRTSAGGYRGAGFDEAFYGMDAVRGMGIPVLTDVHDPWQCGTVNADVIQIPAFLCRQTDLLEAAAQTGKPVNVKKGQFLSPYDMKNVVEKLESFGCKQIMQTERGTTFGYNNLVVDMRSLDIMKRNQYPVIMDCTHAVQLPGGQGTSSGGQREFVETLARAAVAVGVAGVFMEVHNDPDNAPCDGPNMLDLDMFEKLIYNLLRIDQVRKESDEGRRIEDRSSTNS
jgi:2-dehydro-3-deoxyphosphooctonate aldolase (KDO 8-P synthase)